MNKYFLFGARRFLNSLLVRILPKRLYESIPDNYKDFYGVIRAYMAIRGKSLFFVQIGASDGAYEDPLRRYILRYNWPGILVEPVKYVFDELVKNYSGRNNLFFENVAVSSKREKREFYYFAKANGMPQTLKCFGSFLPHVIEKHKARFPDAEKYLRKVDVVTITFDDLIKKYQVSTDGLDILCIDTEGYDYEVIKAIDFRAIRPRMILYEIDHLSGLDMENSVKLLRDNGYSLIKKGRNIFAYLPFRK